MTKPLDDLMIVELTQMVAGPFVGMHLSDYGADVVKIEQPETGEIARTIHPSVGGESFYYMSVNRGKESVVIDLKTAAGKEVFYTLVEEADVLIENYTPGTVARLGIDYETVSERNPSIIYCSISAYGQTGPKAHKSGIDTMLQAYAGVSAMTRDTTGKPLRCGLPIADLAGAMYALQAILMAVYHREKTGEGDYLDVALSDSLLSLLSVRASYAFATNEPFPSIAQQHVYFSPEGIFETADGYIQVSAVTQTHWEQFCRALSRTDLATDSLFESPDKRRHNRERLSELLETEFSKQTTQHWLRQLEEYDVPVERVYDVETVWDDEQTQTREMLTHLLTPAGDRFPTIAPPVKHQTVQPSPSEYIASLGSDTERVLRTIGYTDAEVARLADDDVIQI